ncbi:hypothetical protein [Salinibaculum rarum]|uniref:hypothetical protein n=1 Tax=Salinibaculum rarum TaxID=3058903 RepID=UPI0026603A1F|nr:hypothetical protein [Salinibaculum sp. KK48]
MPVTKSSFAFGEQFVKQTKSRKYEDKSYWTNGDVVVSAGLAGKWSEAVHPRTHDDFEKTNEIRWMPTQNKDEWECDERDVWVNVDEFHEEAARQFIGTLRNVAPNECKWDYVSCGPDLRCAPEVVEFLSDEFTGYSDTERTFGPFLDDDNSAVPDEPSEREIIVIQKALNGLVKQQVGDEDPSVRKVLRVVEAVIERDDDVREVLADALAPFVDHEEVYAVDTFGKVHPQYEPTEDGRRDATAKAISTLEGLSEQEARNLMT